MSIEIIKAGAGTDWDALHSLLSCAFASMMRRIKPPSSLTRLSVEGLAKKAAEETCLLAFDEDLLVGCIFCAVRQNRLYIGKLAVEPGHQGRGIGTRLIREAEWLATRSGLDVLELETRIELTENHKAFTAMGFIRTGESAHPGYDRPTSITMQKRLTGSLSHVPIDAEKPGMGGTR